MSVRCIDQVLNRSQHAGTELLMLIVLADYSDDDGNSYPAVASLARKCRMSSRNANYILSTLQAGGELRVLKNEGPKGTNRYRIMLNALGTPKPLKPTAPLKPVSPLKSASPPEEAFTLKPTSATPEAGFPKPLKPTSDEPSLNRHEPSKRKRAVRAHTSLPAGFAVSERVRKWAAEHGFADFVDAHFEHMVGTVTASGTKYADWDAALQNYIRRDYGNIRKNAARSGRAGASKDSKAGWALKAGFANRFEAENDGCFEHNADDFRGGKLVEVSA